MADSIQFRRGLRSAVKPLPVGMPGFIEDEERLVVGKGDGTNTELPNKADMDNINSQMAEIMKKLPILSLDEYENYKIAIADGMDYAPALQQAINSLPASGGSIIIPNKSYAILTDVAINKDILILGCGYSSILNVKGTIKQNNGTRFLLHDLKIECTNTSNLLEITDKYEIHDVWFYTDTACTFIDLYNAKLSGIRNCWFTSSQWPPLATAVNLHADNTATTTNLDINNNKFLQMYANIKIEGDESYYYNMAGIRIINNMMLSSVYGIITKNADYIQFEQNMIDYTNYPVTDVNTNSFKLRNNYLFSSTSNADIVSITRTIKNRRHLDISGNYLWNGDSTPGNGIHVINNGGNFNYSNIHDNSFEKLLNDIVIESDDVTQTSNNKIHHNIAKNSSNFIKIINGDLIDVEDNLVELDVATFYDISSQTGVNNNFNKNNKWGSKLSEKMKTDTIQGNGSVKTFTLTHNLIDKPKNVLLICPNMGNYTVSYDINNIIVTFDTAPPSGANIVFMWKAQI